MKIVNQTHYRTAWIVSRVRPQELSATFVVKAAYRLVPGGVAVPIVDGERPTGDVPMENGPEGSLYYESDLAPVKVKSDLLLVGSANAPSGQPVAAMNVEFHVGGWSKRLIVVGDRPRRTFRPARFNHPAPFTTMSLGYQNAFGGPTVSRNPLGKGTGDGPAGDWLPNIENPDRLIRGDDPKQEPSGFGPIPRTWPQRCGTLGTCSDVYLRERWPWFPDDFDFAHFNAAPIDQRLGAALRGDELVRFVNMRPDQPDYRSRLPGHRPQLFLRDRPSALGPAMAPLREVRLLLDTLWVDIDAEKLVLVWRGLAPVTDLQVRDVIELHLVGGDLAHPPASVTEYEGRLRQDARRRQEAELEEERRDEAEKAAADADALALRDEMESLHAEYDLQAAADIRAARALLTEQRQDPFSLERPARMALKPGDFADVLTRIRALAPDQHAALAPLISQLIAMDSPAEDEIEQEPSWTRERVQSQLGPDADFAEQVLDRLDLSGLNFTGARLSRASLAGATLRGSVLTRASLRDANLAGADLTDATITGADCSEADFTNAMLDGADLSRSMLTAAVFSKASLKKASLQAVTGHGADFTGADLTSANLRQNRLTQPDFRAATLAAADFTAAVMPHATLEETRAEGILMTGADVSGLRAGRGADFSRGDFRNLVADRSQWEHAILHDAQFQGARLAAANFSAATLRGVHFEHADMPKSVFAEAVLEHCVLAAANLFRGSFERATLRETDLRKANLFEVEFWDVVIEGVRFDGANLKMTKLAGV